MRDQLNSTIQAFLLSSRRSRNTNRIQRKQHDFEYAATAVVYKKAPGDDLWIYRFDPKGHDPKKDKRLAVVFFFGGGWNGGLVTQFEQHSKYLAFRGMVTFVADYRVKLA